MNSILAAALGGAVGGALGSVLGTLVSRLFAERRRRLVQVVISVALTVLGYQVAVAVLAPRLIESPDAVEAQLLQDPDIAPLAHAWRESDAASYRQFVEHMVANVRAGHSRDEVVNRARVDLMAAAVPRLVYLNDAEMIESARLSIDYLDRLRIRRPQICRPFFMGEPFGDLTPYVDADSLAKERDLLEAAFRADTSSPKPVATGDVLSNTLTLVLAGTRERVGDNVLMLTGDSSAEGRDADYCAAASAFYQEILELPPNEAAAFLRGLRVPA